jgi:HEAT repeat protein
MIHSCGNSKVRICLIVAFPVVVLAGVSFCLWWWSAGQRVKRLVAEIDALQSRPELDFSMRRYRSIGEIDEDLKRIGPDAIGPLIAILQDQRSSRRQIAARELGVLKDKRATEALVHALGDQEVAAAMTAAAALGDIRDERAVGPLVVALQDPRRAVRGLSAWALGEIGSPDALRPLIATLEKGDVGDRYVCETAIKKIRDKAASSRPGEE